MFPNDVLELELQHEDFTMDFNLVIRVSNKEIQMRKQKEKQRDKNYAEMQKVLHMLEMRRKDAKDGIREIIGEDDCELIKAVDEVC